MPSMNTSFKGIRIINPVFTEGRVDRAFALPSGFKGHWFHGFSAHLFEATATSRN